MNASKNALYTMEGWRKACFAEYERFMQTLEFKCLMIKFFNEEDAIECMLVNHTNEPIVCIGEWSDLEKGEVFEIRNL